MHSATAFLLYALLCQAPADARQGQGRTPQVDQTVPATRGTRLAIDNYAGEVVVHVWDKDAVRVQARHNNRAKVNVRTGSNTINVEAVATNGPAGSVDYEITAPAWMSMKIEGHYDFVTVDGIQGDVSVETVRGDIVLKNVGPATAKTIEGQIQVEGARGKLALSSVNQDIKVSGASGDLSADTTNGEITLERMESSAIEVTTVNGDIKYDGAFSDRGHYSFTTHNGDLELTLPENTNATFNVRTYNGDFSASLPVKGPDRSQVRQGKRVTYTLGNGGADVELESFGGDISVRRGGAGRTRRD
jgi:DUF4097 and DUF4098 domain-containing protein YvlB